MLTLASYLLGTSNQANEGEETNIRPPSVTSDDDWVLVDQLSEGNSNIGSSASLDEYDDFDNEHNQLPCLITRGSSTASLPCTTMEESWFVTPPPCFTSTGPIHMETSPLENRLIEHPSTSGYQHTHPALITRHHSTPKQFITVTDYASEEESEDEEDEALSDVYAQEIQRIEANLHRLTRAEFWERSYYVDIFPYEKKQRGGPLITQKVTQYKSHKLLTCKHPGHAKKAREVTHNRHKQRSNHFHGKIRSNGNTNRKF